MNHQEIEKIMSYGRRLRIKELMRLAGLKQIDAGRIANVARGRVCQVVNGERGAAVEDAIYYLLEQKLGALCPAKEKIFAPDAPLSKCA